jgi:hypothetical protein
MDSRHSRQQATRCMQLAETTPSSKLKALLITEAEAWNSLAEDQEWLEQRAVERRSHDALAGFPTIRAMLASHTNPPPSRRAR